MLGILRDVQSGALPKDQIASFLFWLLRKSFWGWFMLIVIGALLIVA